MHIYFSGIGGVAIGPLALICRDLGYKVSGSDLSANRFTKIIETAGISVTIGQDGSHIAKIHAAQPIDWLVISAALPPDHSEILFAEQHNIKISKRAEMINFLLNEKNLNLIAISGTHGKTTTTAMTVWLFKQFNIPVSYSIGTSLSFGASGHYQAGSEYFIYECDEYDRNMLAFHPYLSLITNVDYDHTDTYPLPRDYDEAFKEFIGQSTQVIMWQTDAQRLSIDHPALTELTHTTNLFTSIKLVGEHNRQNALLAVGAFLDLFPDYHFSDVVAKMNEFPGTDRRFEKLAKNIYSDYAHHPSEIRATLQLANELNDHVIVVYQPHQNIRQHQVASEYKDCFSQASHVYWLPTYLSREDPNLALLSPAELTNQLTDSSVAEPAEMNEALIDKLQKHRKDNNLIVFMGAGSIDQWARAHFAQ